MLGIVIEDGKVSLAKYTKYGFGRWKMMNVQSFDCDIVDGVIGDKQLFCDTIKAYQRGRKRIDAFCCLGYSKVIYRFVTFPDLPPKRLAQAVESNMASYFAFDLNPFIMSYRVCGKRGKQWHVVLVCIPRKVVETLVTILSEMGCELRFMELYMNRLASDLERTEKGNLVFAKQMADKIRFGFLAGGMFCEVRDVRLCDLQDNRLAFEFIDWGYSLNKAYLFSEMPIVKRFFRERGFAIEEKWNEMSVLDGIAVRL